MSDTVIRVENLGKKYVIAHQNQERYTALRDVIAEKANSLGRKLLPLGKKHRNDATQEEFWALKDVSFEIKRGEVVGIIGRNGAGKSTLLKILSRITEPTTGRVAIKGRVASLLEVGTGFHPELTGRENIYLNGAILGMSKVEIRQKFDRIVAFAEVEKFLDTPVKRYSSGMYVRLAFAVAAHLEPEILIVDEVLAVGDAQFQSKCMNKMQDVASESRTVLFVSHNMGAIRRLCSQGALLQNGKLAFVGDTDMAVSKYQSEAFQLNEKSPGRFERSIRDAPVRDTWVAAIELQDSSGNCCNRFRYGQQMRIVFILGGKEPRKGMSLSWIMSDNRGANISWSNSLLTCGFSLDREEKSAVCTITNLPLAVGKYTLSFSGGIVGSSQPKDIWYDAAQFEVVECDPFLTKNEHRSEPFGSVVLNQQWSIS